MRNQLKSLQPGLSGDELVEFTVAFVQGAIDYDWETYHNIDEGTLRYPYETLYDGTGVCADKTILLAKLLKAKISESEMRFLNEEIDLHKKTYADVARNFLESKGLVQKTPQSAPMSSRWDELLAQSWQHLWLSAVSLFCACLIAVPMGI